MCIAGASKAAIGSRDRWEKRVADSHGSSGLAKVEASVRFRIRLKSPIVL